MPTTTAAPTVPRNTDAVQVVHVAIPDGVVLPPLPCREDRAGHYQKVLLNVRTGELSFFCTDWRVYVPFPEEGEDRTLWESQHPGASPQTSVGMATTRPVPNLLSFTIDTWTPIDGPAVVPPPTPAWVYMTREQGEAFVASLVPLAQQLVDNLFRVPGTDDLEWSAESAATVQAIYDACSRDQQGPREGDVSLEGMVNFAGAAEAVPELVKGEWAEMDDAALDSEADSLNRVAGRWHPQLKERFGRPYRDGSGTHLDVYGARSWLYAYRAHVAEHPVLNAAAWFAQPDHTLTRRVTADHDNGALAEFADREREAAAREGVKLVGVERVIRAYRDDLRERILEDDLPRACEQVERLKRAKATRSGLLGQIIGWGDPRYHSNNDAELGRRAGLTRQAVNRLRKVLTDEDDAG
jgi:hypothetical protein